MFRFFILHATTSKMLLKRLA